MDGDGEQFKPPTPDSTAKSEDAPPQARTGQESLWISGSDRRPEVPSESNPEDKIQDLDRRSGMGNAGGNEAPNRIYPRPEGYRVRQAESSRGGMFGNPYSKYAAEELGGEHNRSLSELFRANPNLVEEAKQIISKAFEKLTEDPNLQANSQETPPTDDPPEPQ